MGQAVTQDFSNATEIADYLANKGLPFRQAHEIVGKLVLHCTQKGIYLLDVPLETYKEMSSLFEEDLYEVLSPYAAVKRRNSAVEQDLNKSKRFGEGEGVSWRVCWKLIDFIGKKVR